MTNAAPKNILIIAGEPSGDLHGAGVVRELLRSQPDLQIFGIGGDGMAEAGQEQLYTTHEMAILGFVEVVRHLPFLLKVKRHLMTEIRRRKPACAILIDYPGFNVRFAKHLKKAGIPIVYYIAPQVWAWGKKRIPTMARLVEHLAVVFPFEQKIFQDAGLKTTFVGHPLLEGLKPELNRDAFFSKTEFSQEHAVIGLLPGSRENEVRLLLPTMLQALNRLKESMPDLQAVVAASPIIPHELYEELIARENSTDIRLLKHKTYAVMQHSTACIVASGTATLETGCFGTPLIIGYRVARLTYEIARRLVKLDNIGLINIVAGKTIATELIQNDFTPDRVQEELHRLLTNSEKTKEMKTELNKIKSMLGAQGASRKVADIALELAC